MTLPVPVTFLPSETIAWVDPGTTVLEAGRQAGIMIAAPCGGRGICGSCGVRVSSGDLCPPDEEERRGLARAPKGVRLACRAKVCEAVTVRPVVSAAKPHRSQPCDGCEVVIAIDLGTTNVACVAVESDGGRAAGEASVPNAQQSWGADVLSRVAAAMAGDADTLRSAAEDSVATAIEAAVGSGRVRRAVLAGNTAMVALLAGADVASLAAHPFSAPPVPRALGGETPVGRALGGAEVLLVPPLVAFVGGDALAGAVHTGLLYAEKPTLLVDLGTNAEIVLAVDGRLFAGSAAAGPAFEASGIECGGPAIAGAITGVDDTADGLAIHTLGSADPRWLTGSGLVSLLAALRRVGRLAPDGAFVASGPLSDAFSRGEDGVLSFEVAPGVALSQLDVRALQLAKSAVRAGIDRVLTAAGITPEQIDHLYVAGAFGGALRSDDLIDLGVVPAAAGGALRFVGNASLLGAASLALAPDVLEELDSHRPAVEHVDLAADPGFSAALVSGLSLEAS